MSLCACVHKIYVRILYIFHILKQKREEQSKLSFSGLRERPVNMGSPVRGEQHKKLY